MLTAIKPEEQVKQIREMCIRVLDSTTLYDCMSKCLAEEILRYLNSN